MAEEQLDFFAQAARDTALTQVTDNAGSWMDMALDQLPRLRRQMTEFTGEQLRLEITDAIGAPHHHNAWGALVMIAVNRKIIYNTGSYVAMKTTKSHARRTPVYRWM